MVLWLRACVTACLLFPSRPQLLPFALRGTYQNAGQNCVGAERFYVYSAVHDEFVKKVRVACFLCHTLHRA